MSNLNKSDDFFNRSNGKRTVRSNASCEHFSSSSSDTICEQEQSRSRMPFILQLLCMVALVLVFSFVLRTFILQPYEIPSGSMEETIMPNDRVFSERISYYFNSPVQGDIVTFVDPDDSSRILIKRCIATAGQTVDLQNGVVYVDGQALSEDYTNGKPSYPLNSEVVTYPYTVPDGCIWVMGDNRTSSLDSRYFGAVPILSITGHAFFTYWPFDRLGLLK